MKLEKGKGLLQEKDQYHLIAQIHGNLREFGSRMLMTENGSGVFEWKDGNWYVQLPETISPGLLLKMEGWP
jgi:hypothetical protein